MLWPGPRWIPGARDFSGQPPNYNHEMYWGSISNLEYFFRVSDFVDGFFSDPIDQITKFALSHYIFPRTIFLALKKIVELETWLLYSF